MEREGPPAARDARLQSQALLTMVFCAGLGNVEHETAHDFGREWSGSAKWHGTCFAVAGWYLSAYKLNST